MEPFASRLQQCLDSAVSAGEMAGLSVLILRRGEELCYAASGEADKAAHAPIRRDSIFRLYSQSKPITAAAVVMLADRGVIDLMDPVSKYLPGFEGQRVATAEGTAPVARPVNIMDLLGMTSGLCYPGDDDAAGLAAQALFAEEQSRIDRGEGRGTVALANAMGQLPLAFQPGAHFRYGTSADVAGAVVEAADGRRFSRFLQEELFAPLGMKDTGFHVPADKHGRLVTCYERTAEGLAPFTKVNLCVGRYDVPPAFESGGAGLCSTLDDYAAFATMLHAEGLHHGRRILSPQAVRFLTTAQLADAPRLDLWSGMEGYSYGKLMRVMVEPGKYPGFSRRGEYGWDGWLGTYFTNLPEEGLTLLIMQNVTDCGTSAATRKIRNLTLAAESMGEL